MSRKVLITGSGGLLGSAFAASDALDEKILCPSSALDITDFEAVKNMLTVHSPDIIIHCAAHTDVEGGEVDADRSYLVNTKGSENLVNAALLLPKEPTFCFISSTGVYGQHKSEPYTELDDTLPTTIHHKSKLEAEKIVAGRIKKHLVIRTGWLFGGSKWQAKNFVYKRYLEALNASIIFANSEQVGNPTFIDDVVKQVLLLLANKYYGVFNCVNEGVATRYEYISEVVSLFELPCAVESTDKSKFNRIAPVSNNESATNYNLASIGLNIMPHWKNSLRVYISGLRK